MKYVTIMGVPFLHTDQASFVNLLVDRIDQQEKTYVVTANPEIVMKANEDAAFMQDILQANYIIADGIGVVKAAQILGNPLPGRVTGFDTTMELLKIANEKHYKLYLLGAKKETLEKTVANIARDYPGVEIVGSHDGYFNWEKNHIAETIAELKPDLVLVALGFPKQEKWIVENLSKFDHGVFIGIGGTFDIIAGTAVRAPLAWQKLGLEWLHRLIKQPSRWRRMLVLPQFAGKIIAQKVKGASS
ncbi:WecB/TagA/CpsF family glycosyltransferase [Caldibacillus lycopersici]|uniref:N-acetylglucosaminyldiphosphoundecaprenol N-acetyl-beta-D-mannosaminyltransferase n=1 Tax=Perspicuibacillus lycopersici TaxID=1325689 RepID=A0AAE3IRQ8_9BACI|nr:WecB/TagA/CpsF family glycosyltransferase [Perspicuibacillus lycopersici]MCU9613207.1 WecB/TagA/CpsF family glycosyltransferase [Perspicuibacillus lycopersici]